MSDWKEYSLAQITEPIKDTWLPNASESIPYIGLEHIQPENLRLNSVGNSTEVASNKFKFRSNDILFGKLRPYFRKVVKPQFDGICSTDIWVFRSKEGIDQDFLYYFLANWDFVDTANGADTGTRMPRADWDFLKDTIWRLPEKQEQAIISANLSSLDDKIDLLHRQNQTLEALAETLLRQWVIAKSEKDWIKDKLGNIADVQNGYAFSSREYVTYSDGLLEVLKMGHIKPGGGLRTNPKKDYVPREQKLEKWTLNKNDIVMAMTDMKDNVVILGVPAMIDKGNHYVLNQRVARISLSTKAKITNPYLLYIQMKTPEFISELQSKANSGVQVNLSTEAIKDSDIYIPPYDFQFNDGKIISDIYIKKENNDKQIRTLAELRDTLLPKLMSGEVRVKG